jgi:hypothetical protein
MSREYISKYVFWEENIRYILKYIKKVFFIYFKKVFYKKNMYKELENRILNISNGKPSQEFTPSETAELFRENITSEFIIRKGLITKVLNPNITLLQILPRSKDKNYLILIALCLRYGADPNLYVSDSKIGNIHILGYVYTLFSLEFRNTSIFNTIIMILIAKGSDPNLPFFKGNISGNVVRDRSVIGWLNDNRYANILSEIQNVTALKNNTDDKSLLDLSLILNDKSLATVPYTAKNYSLAIRAFCDLDIIKMIPFDNTVKIFDYKVLYDCLDFVNFEVFKYLITFDDGSSEIAAVDKTTMSVGGGETGKKEYFVPSYVFINEILIRMKETNFDYVLIFNELKNFIIATVNVGVQYDQEQYIIINSLNFTKEFNEAYQIPLWKKLCSNIRDTTVNSSTVNPTIKKLAISLNIDPTLDARAICENLTRMSEIDGEKLKDANRRRQQMRINANLGYIYEFTTSNTPSVPQRTKSPARTPIAPVTPVTTGGTTKVVSGNGAPELKIKNADKLPFDYLDYNDMDIFFYRDSNDDVYAITSELFDSVLETGINPLALNETRNNKLSQVVLLKIKQKKDILRLLYIEPDPLGVYSANIPVSFADSVDSLKKKDMVSEKQALDLVNKFIILANYNGVSAQQVRNYTKKDMMKKLKNIGFDINFEPLSTSHALVTTAYIVLNLDVKSNRKFF